jgi:hypothetical protein
MLYSSRYKFNTNTHNIYYNLEDRQINRKCRNTEGTVLLVVMAESKL